METSKKERKKKRKESKMNRTEKNRMKMNQNEKGKLKVVRNQHDLSDFFIYVTFLFLLFRFHS